MKFFFTHRAFKKNIIQANPPLRSEYMARLKEDYQHKITVLNTAPTNRLRVISSYVSEHPFSISLASGIAIVVLVIVAQLSPAVLHTPANAVLAESLQNTLYPIDSSELRYQQITSQLGRIRVWQNGQNVRFDDLFGSTLYSSIDNQTCHFEYNSEKKIQCTVGFDSGENEPLIPGELLSVSGLTIEKAQDTHGDLYITWTTDESLQKPAIHISTGRSGFTDMEWEGVYSWVDDNGHYVNRITLFSEDLRNNTHVGNPALHLVQISNGPETSRVYEINLDSLAVREVQTDELDTLREEYKKNSQKEFINGAIERTYEFHFMKALYIYERVDELGEPTSVTEEEYKGQSVLRMKYTLTNAFFSEEEPLPDPSIEFIISKNDNTILEYTFWRGNEAVEQTQIDETKTITDIPSEDFFSVNYWKKEMEKRE
jgi:hypothetical protein